MAKDDHVLALTPEERNFRVTFDRAVACAWKSDEGNADARTLVFENPFGLHQVFEKMMHGRDEGYAMGARVFRLVLAEQLTDRVTRSHIMTKLALAMSDASDTSEVVETEVAWFGRFARCLIIEMPTEEMSALFAQWVEDMAAQEPHKGFFPQPTALIRGVLFAPAIDQLKFLPFWELALKSDRFPLRIFSDPCASRDGSILSSYQQRTIRIILENASEAAAAVIATHMREHLRSKMVGEYKDGRMVDRPEPVTDSERNTVFDSIASAIEHASRRSLVSGWLGVQ